ncbi:MAG: putative lipid II flippase FtsW [Coriobacteriales bacterium]|jgi:cell division protein FtsW
MVEEQDKERRAARRSRDKGRGDMAVLTPRLTFIISVALLLAIGLVMVYSASAPEAYRDFNDTAYFLKREVIWVAAGVVLTFIVAKLPFGLWNRKVLWVIWGIMVAILIFNHIAGFVGLGARRWIMIGPFTFQPSEFAKIAMMLLAASIVIGYRNGEFRSFGQFAVVFIGSIAIPTFLILAQPDLGTVLVALVGILAVLWFGEFSKRIIAAVIIAVIVLALLAIVSQGFRSDRIAAWIHPEDDPAGTGYQILNSFYAFSEGGVFGVGLGNSTQKYLYLPFAYNDFIFAVIGEEFGLIGCAVIIVLFLVMLRSALQIGEMASSPFAKIIACSSATVIAFQAFLNMACTIGALPVTGKPLPFISYGGSSMFATMILVGFVLAVSFQSSDDTATRRRKDIRVYETGSGGSSSYPSRTRRGA